MCVLSLCGNDVIGYLYGSYPYLGTMLSKLHFDWWTSLRKQFGCVGSLSNDDVEGNEKSNWFRASSIGKSGFRF